MPPVCLITGASSGIGAALAERFAARGDDLVLTARRGDRLAALAADLRERHRVRVGVIPEDLADPLGAERLLTALAARDLKVTTLVNNAGFGLRGDYTDNPWHKASAMLQLMVMSPAHLCHALLPAMQAAGGGTIVTIASLAGLIPGLPGSTLYSASKAFLIRFSQSLAAENRSSGVRVLAVCPGYVRTEFHAVLGVEARMQRLPGLFWMDASVLAQRVVAALDGQRAVMVPGAVNSVIATLSRLLPPATAEGLSASFSRRYRGRP